MPTNRKKVTRNRRLNDIKDHVLDYLVDGEIDPEIHGRWPGVDAKTAKKAWKKAGKAIVRDYAEQHPGKRPFGWWEFEAPELRKRLGGIGDPGWLHLSGPEIYDKGIPAMWIDPFDVEFYNGRAKTVTGKPFEYEYAQYEDGNFTGKAIDINDPPCFEGEASYLRRLNLLIPGELEKLTPADFEPVYVYPDDE